MGNARPVTPKLPDLDRSSSLKRGKPRAFEEWRALRRWGKLPPWEVGVPGYMLRLARVEAGLSQVELADRLDVSQQAVSRAERWHSNPTVGLMTRWAEACGARIEIQLQLGT